MNRKNFLTHLSHRISPKPGSYKMVGKALTLSVLLSSSLLVQPSDAAAGSKNPTRSARANTPDTVGEFANFGQWQGVSEFIDQLVERDGFNKVELESLLRKTRYLDSAIQLMKPAPAGRPKNWRAYRARFVEPVRINAGAAFWDQYADALSRAEAQYGVPAEIIVGIIGVETVYGRNTGNFRVMDAITTLAFAYPNTPNREARSAYFKGELENTLLYARDAGLDPFSLRGSYAGAIGWPQFMPGSIRQFALDFDGDGRIDLRNSPVDAIGSVANFLVKHGWKPGEPIVFPASIAAKRDVPAEAIDGVTTSDKLNPLINKTEGWQRFIGQGLEASYSVAELKTEGVLPGIEPPTDMRFGLVDLQNGEEPTEYWLGANNFYAITQYNRSFFYAMSVIDLGRAVRAARTPAGR